MIPEKLVTLSVIVPFRATGVRSYIADRICNLLERAPLDPQIEIIFVDSGSDQDCAHDLQVAIEEAGHRYLYHDTRGKVFSIGDVRDTGVQFARGYVVTFLDADLVFDDAFFPGLLALIKAKDMVGNPDEFFVIPCIYLTPKGTQEFVTCDIATRRQRFLALLLYGDTDLVQNIAPCSSVMVVNRHRYLAMGGHRPEFSGHGYEDFEFLHRMLTSTGKFPRRADNYFRDSRTWANSFYDGFRSQYALLGREAMLNGLFTFHLWHERPNDLSYHSRGAGNRVSALTYFKEYDEDRMGPHPLPDLTRGTGKKVLFFGIPRSAASECLREVFPLFGDVVYVSEFAYWSPESGLMDEVFSRFLDNSEIDLIVFPNPYANPARLAIYQWVKACDFPFVCWERGALPDSWFFDPLGFNADSGSYSESRWNRELTDEEIDSVERYLEEIILGDCYLESQGDRLTGRGLRSRLGIHGRKVLFVPFQRPSDTVIKYFSGAIGSFDDFVSQIDELAAMIAPLGWDVVCKKHPLEAESPTLAQARYVPDDSNIVDLVEMSDAVALINSGVGLYAAILGTPCYVFGDAFYINPALNRSVSTADEIRESIEGGLFSVDIQTVYRFIFYLRYEFYSFASPQTYSRTERDGSARTITYRLDFRSINLPTLPRIDFARHVMRPTDKAYLFEPYWYAMWRAKNGKVAANVPGAVDAKFQRPAANAHKGDRLAGRGRRLVRKLLRNPYGYFNDSRIKFLRPLRYAFRARRT